MDKIQEIRRDNLRAIIADLSSTQSDIAKALKLTPTELSQMKTGEKEIVDWACEKIEFELGKPSGWMSRDNLGINLTADEYEFVFEFRGLSIEIREHFRNLTNAIKRRG